LEPIGNPEAYGNDRIFVYLRQTGDLDQKLIALKNSGHPALEISIPDLYAVGSEMYRWEIATAIACSILGVNAFDQPNVETSKKLTKAKIAEYQKNGELKEGQPSWNENGVAVFPSVPISGTDLKTILENYLKNARPGGYVAVNAYLPRNAEMDAMLQQMRTAIRSATGNAVTTGFGPRFQHSTGQFHKGGLENALFIQITADPEKDIDIPNQGLTFGTLIRAQALGDFEALIEAQRTVLRIHLPGAKDLQLVVDALR
jgi:transaldolase/glucose-6-phosphate isomerase